MPPESWFESFQAFALTVPPWSEWAFAKHWEQKRLRDFSGCDSLVFAKTSRSTPWLGWKKRARNIGAIICAMQATPRRGVEGDRAASAAAGRLWAHARDRPARSRQRALLHRADRLPVAPAAQGLAPLHHGAALFLRVARQRGVADHQSCPAD